MLTPEGLRKALKEVLAEKQGEAHHIQTTDPAQVAHRLNAVMNEMVPVIMIVSGNDRKLIASFMDSIVAIMLDDFKKAVVEEVLKSPAQAQLDEILGRKP